MGYVKINLKPGIIKETTEFAAEGSYVDGNRYRFRYGQAQTLSGWIKWNPGLSALDGVCRAIFPWKALDSTLLLAAGTDKRLYIISGGQLNDVTPIRVSGTLTNPFATTIGLSTITVT